MPGRQVRDANGGFGLVDVLAAGAAGTHRIDLQVVGVDVDFDVVGFGQHGDGGGEVWMRPWVSVSGTRCTRWPPLSYCSC